MNTQHYILLGAWFLYGMIHSLLATRKCKNYLGRLMNDRSYRILYNIIAVLLLAAILSYHLTVKSLLMKLPVIPGLVAGTILTSCGAIIMFICIRKYFAQLSGLNGINKAGHLAPVLEITGLHAYVRHPLYFGTFIFLAGLFFLSPQLKNLIAVLAIILYTLIGIRFEEKKLIKQFGDQYLAYKKKVPMIIPYKR